MDSLGFSDDIELSPEALLAFGLESTERPPIAIDPNTCSECGGAFQVQGKESICKNCGAVGELYEEEGGAQRAPVRLQVTGPQSRYFQRDLDRSGSPDYQRQQLEAITQEYNYYNKVHVDKGKKGFSEDILKAAALMFNQLQQSHAVLRNQRKKAVMVACLTMCSVRAGIYHNPHEIAEMIQLQTGGVSRGNDILRGLVEKHDIDLDLSLNPIPAMAGTALSQCAHLRSEVRGGQPDEQLTLAIEEIVNTAEVETIGSGSKTPSKVHAAAYEVLRRAGEKVDLAQVAAACNTRANTLQKFLTSLSEYHSYFAPIYEKYGLDAAKA